MRAPKILLSVLLLAGLIFGVAGSAIAQEGGSGIQVSPTRSEITVEQGKAETVTISLRNTTSGEVIAKPIINDFYSDNETGQPKLVIDTAERGPYSIANLISGLQDVELKAGESKDLQVFVQIPANQPSGAYFGAVRFNAVPKASDSLANGDAPQVSLTASVGVLMLIEVPGDITERIELQKVTAYHGENSGSMFVDAPNRIGVSIKNLGNGYARPFGQVVVKNAFGKEVAKYDLNNTNPRGNILPDSTRTFSNDIRGVKWPGRYSITASVSHGRGGEVLSIDGTFWYLPWWFVGVIAAIVLILVFVAWRLYRKFLSQPVTKRRH